MSGAQSVDLSSIERALDDLWSQTSSTEGEEGHPVIRARAINLVVCSLVEREHETAEIINEITNAHPARTILISKAARTDGTGIRASVSAHCRSGLVSGAHICGEQINLSVAADALEETPGTVRELLLPDLPVFLWWRGDLPSTPKLFEQFLDLSDRVIVDSADLSQPLNLTGFFKRDGHPTAITDLAWGRLASWRQLTAQFFDGPVLRPYLESITRVTIESGARADGGEFTPEACLFLGWLATRLHWEFVSTGRKTPKQGCVSLHFTDHGRAITTELFPANMGGGIFSVAMQAEDSARFSITREHAGLFQTHTEAPVIGEMNRVVHGIKEGLVELMVRELELLDRDPIYEEALFAAAAIAHRVMDADA